MTFNYDNLQNWISVVEGSVTTNYTNYTNGLNQYSTIGTTDLEYDDNGNLTQYGTKHYLYDAENQMIAYYNLTGDPNETAVSLYSYDDFGRRISKASATGVGATAGAVTESYLYDGFQVIGEYNTDDMHIKRRFVYAVGIDEPICMIVEPDHQGWYGLSEFSAIASSWLCDANDICYEAEFDFNANDAIDASDLFSFVSNYYLDERPPLENSKYYGYVFNGTGSVVAMTYRNDPNQTGDPNELPYFVETYQYTPFGEVSIYDATSQLLTQSAIGNPYMFTGRRLDSESGLYYYRYRMYSPEIGRFIQTDPIGYYDSMNMYQYCINNPGNWVDPWGEFRFGRRDLKNVPKFFPPGSRYYIRPLGIYGGILNIGYYHEAGFYQDGTGDYASYGTSGDEWFNDGYHLSPFVYDDDIMRKAQKCVDSTDLFTDDNFSLLNNCQRYVMVLRMVYKKLGGKIKYRPFNRTLGMQKVHPGTKQ